MGKLTDLAKAIDQPKPDSKAARLRELREAAAAQSPELVIPDFLRREDSPEQQKRLDAVRAREKAKHTNPGRFIKNPPDKARDTGLGMSPSALLQHGALTKEELEAMGKRKTTGKGRKTASTTKSPARASKPAVERAHYDWKKHEAAALEGKMPARLDFSAETHKRFRPTLKVLEDAAKAGDVKALRGVKISLVSSSPKMLDRWRNMCLKALAAQAAPAKPAPKAAAKPQAAAPAKADKAKAPDAAKPAAPPAQQQGKAA